MGDFVAVDVDFWSNQRIAFINRGSKRERMETDVGKPASLTRFMQEFKNRNSQKGLTEIV